MVTGRVGLRRTRGDESLARSMQTQQEDTRRVGWALTMQKYVADERGRRAATRSAMDKMSNAIEVLKKKRP
jgi:hypothetical protein